MFPEPLKWTDQSVAMSRRETLPNVTAGDDTAFVLAYETAVALSEQRSELGACRTWLDANTGDQAEPLALEEFGRPGALVTVKETLLRYDPIAPSDPAAHQAGAPPPAATLDKSQLAIWMDAHALSRSSHHCAMYCRQGMEAAGLSTDDRPRSGDAGDYGPFLLRHGAQVVSQNGYAPQVGDTVVFEKTDQHPNGHIEIYDGRQWVSDFRQHSFSPYRDAGSTPPFAIYRLT